MARRTRPVEGQAALFDANHDERDEPAAGIDRSTSDEHPERELDDQDPAWREWTLRRVELPALVEVTSVETGKPRGRCRADAMLAVLEALAAAAGDRRGVALSKSELARLARLSPSHAERATLALESLYLVEIHRRDREPGRQREPHTYALGWGNLRELVPPAKALGEPSRCRPLVRPDVPSHEATRAAGVASHEGTGPLVTSPRGAAPTSSGKHVCNAHDGLRNRSAEDWLGNVEPENLRDLEWLEAAFGRAVAAGHLNDDGPGLVFVVALACHALRKGKRSPGGMFRRGVEGAKRDWPTDGDTEAAQAMLRRRDRRRRPATSEVTAGIGNPVPSPGISGREFEQRKLEASQRLLEHYAKGAADG